ncbi:MAG: hypothetical protein ACI9Y1_002691 [Lentisphaeria bacterium]|jgi:hypothetical protein
MNDSNDQQFSEEEVSLAELQIQERTKRIEYFTTEYTIELLAQKVHNGDYIVPDYQREFTWEEERKWRFVESILMGLPIPFFFFWEDSETGKLEIVDGSQRLRTIEEFLYDDLELGVLDKLPALEGFKFSDLPESRQRKVKNRSIRGIVLSEHTDAEARIDLFERINTGSKAANKAEIRRGALRGPFLDLVIELAQNDRFIALAPVSLKQLKEREREELVTRFFAYGDGLDDYADEVSPFLFAYSRHMNKAFSEDPKLIGEYRSRFNDTMDFIANTFIMGFRRTEKGKVSPRSRFESIAIGSYYAKVKNPSITVSRDSVASWIDTEEFRKVIGADGANAIARLKGRIEYVRNKLLDTAEK